MAIFQFANCLVYQRVNPIVIPWNSPLLTIENHHFPSGEKSPFSYGFPMVFLWFSYGLNHQKTPLDHHPIKFWRPALGRLREWRSSFVAGPRPPTPGDHRCRSQTSNSGISRGVSWHIHIIYISCYLQITCIYIYRMLYIYIYTVYTSQRNIIPSLITGSPFLVVGDKQRTSRRPRPPRRNLKKSRSASKKTLEFRWWIWWIKLKPVFWYTYPSEKWSESQLGWWNSQYMEKNMFQTTDQKLFLL